MNGILKLRPSRPEDEPFLRQLRMEVNAERLCMNQWLGGDDGMKEKVLEHQFRALSTHQNILRKNWETKDNVLELDGVPIGFFMVTGNDEEIRLSEVAVLVPYRGMGLGKMVIETTKAECVKSGRVMRLCVRRDNLPAVQLYIQQGFYVIEQQPMHAVMEWNPKGPTQGKLYFHGKKTGGKFQ